MGREGSILKKGSRAVPQGQKLGARHLGILVGLRPQGLCQKLDLTTRIDRRASRALEEAGLWPAQWHQVALPVDPSLQLEWRPARKLRGQHGDGLLFSDKIVQGNRPHINSAPTAPRPSVSAIIWVEKVSLAYRRCSSISRRHPARAFSLSVS